MKILGMKILVIEDNESFRVLLHCVLTTLCDQHDIVFAETVSEALPLLDNADVVITDVEYPGGGHAVMRAELISRQKPYFVQSSSHFVDDHAIGVVNKANIVSELVPMFKNKYA